MKPRSHFPVQEQGFTLLEMLVVVAVVSVLLVVGFSGFSGVNQRVTAQNQAEQLRALIRDGATLAASRSLPLTLTVNGGMASLKSSTATLRTAAVDKITTGLVAGQAIGFDTTGRVALPTSSSTLTLQVNGQNRTLLISGIGQTRWQ